MRWYRFPIFVSAVLLAFLFGLFITTGDTYAVDSTLIGSIDYSSCFYFHDGFIDNPTFDPDLDYDAWLNSCFWQDQYSGFDYYVINFSADGIDANYLSYFSNCGAFETYYYIPINSSFPIFSQCFNDFLFDPDSPFVFDPGNISFYPVSYSDSFSLTVDFYSINSSGLTPSGNIDIIENGQYDVTNYATATVNVPPEVIQGDYHDDLVSINNSIIVCAAVCLVLYFFYCIYRLIIRNSGVK